MSAAPALLPRCDTTTPQIRANVVRYQGAGGRLRPQQLVPPRGGASATLHPLSADRPLEARAPTGGCRVLLCVDGAVRLRSGHLDTILGPRDLALVPTGTPHRVESSGRANLLAVDFIRFPAFHTAVARAGQIQPVREHPLFRLGLGVFSELLGPRDLRLLVGPETGLMRPRYAITGPQHLVITLATTPPGTGPAMHVHTRTHEAFIVLDGQFDVVWGDRAEHHERLNRLDAIVIPPGVNRTFRNVGDTTGAILPIVVGADDELEDIAWLSSVRDDLAERVPAPLLWVAEKMKLRFVERERP
ncbi:MAG: cupin domain-containing protein [Alphaproteobacteria bacterium]|nr:cupin domain-containing protein [Alphaproteobacteria bacterium]